MSDHVAAAIAGRWFIALREAGMPLELAGGCAKELARMMREHPAPEYYVVATEEAGDVGRLSFLTEPPTKPGQQLVDIVPAARWRRDVERVLEAERDGQSVH